MYAEEMDLLREMLALTKHGKLCWRKTDLDSYQAQIENEVLTVEYVFLARTDDVGSDRTLARLSAFNLVLDYGPGTEGMGLITEMLSLSDPEWIKLIQRTRQRLQDGLGFLRRLDQG